MRGSNDLDFTSLRTVYYSDNNDQPAGGARVAFTLSTDGKGFFGDLSVGASATGGRYDRAAKLDYRAVGADASMKLGPFTLRGEYATRRTDVDTSASGYRGRSSILLVKEGWYAEIEHPLGKRLDLVYRYDELRRRGVRSRAPPDAGEPARPLHRGPRAAPAQAVYVKLAWEYWIDETMIGTPAGTTRSRTSTPSTSASEEPSDARHVRRNRRPRAPARSRAREGAPDPRDFGAASIDVSKYPEEQQRRYEC